MGTFRCDNCGKEKPNTQLSYITLAADIFFVLVTFGLLWHWLLPSDTCRECESKTYLIGTAVLALFVLCLLYVVGLRLGLRAK
jgi:hypothetical protein